MSVLASRQFELPAVVIGGVRPLHRAMLRENVVTTHFDHHTAVDVFDVALVGADAEPRLEIRGRALPVVVTVPITSQYRARPAVDEKSYRALCAALTPGEAPHPSTVLAWLRGVVADAPAVLARTRPSAA